MVGVTFYDLPKDVRQTIARLHLVREEPITLSEHRKIATFKDVTVHNYRRHWRRSERKIRYRPPLLVVDKKHEKEMAQIYYGENHFLLAENGRQIERFKRGTWPRHLHMITTLTFDWDANAYSSEGIRELNQLKGLQTFFVRVDERRIIEWKTPGRIRPDRELTLNQHRLVMKAHGMNALLSLTFPRVEFVPKIDSKGEKYGGAIPGGVLETVVRRRMMGDAVSEEGPSSFDFLSLTPELRNNVYSLMFTMAAPLRPTYAVPSPLIPRWSNRSEPVVATPGSVLNLLLANKQIHDEACGIFYSSNAFIFEHPLQFHAFILNLSRKRRSNLQNVTIYYHNIKIADLDVADMAFSALRRLTGLRKLRIVMNSPQHHIRGTWRKAWPNFHPILSQPGIKRLFALRNITDMKVEYEWLNSEMKTVREHASFPDVEGEMTYVIRFKEFLRRFNLSLADAQRGKVDEEMLATEKDYWSVEQLPSMTEAILHVDDQ